MKWTRIIMACLAIVFVNSCSKPEQVTGLAKFEWDQGNPIKQVDLPGESSYALPIYIPIEEKDKYLGVLLGRVFDKENKVYFCRKYGGEIILIKAGREYRNYGYVLDEKSTKLIFDSAPDDINKYLPGYSSATVGTDPQEK